MHSSWIYLKNKYCKIYHFINLSINFFQSKKCYCPQTFKRKLIILNHKTWNDIKTLNIISIFFLLIIIYMNDWSFMDHECDVSCFMLYSSPILKWAQWSCSDDQRWLKERPVSFSNNISVYTRALLIYQARTGNPCQQTASVFLLLRPIFLISVKDRVQISQTLMPMISYSLWSKRSPCW